MRFGNVNVATGAVEADTVAGVAVREADVATRLEGLEVTLSGVEIATRAGATVVEDVGEIATLSAVAHHLEAGAGVALRLRADGTGDPRLLRADAGLPHLGAAGLLPAGPDALLPLVETGVLLPHLAGASAAP